MLCYNIRILTLLPLYGFIPAIKLLIFVSDFRLIKNLTSLDISMCVWCDFNNMISARNCEINVVLESETFETAIMILIFITFAVQPTCEFCLVG